MYRILLADDEQIVIDSLSFIIERNFPGQIELRSARSGADAIGACQTSLIDIAFMDINMPGLNGIEVIQSIKLFSPSTVVIVLTAFDRFDYAQQAVNLGVFEYLSKPVNRNKIAETLRAAMSAVDIQRRRHLSDIHIREKLDSVVNIVESDFIYSLIFPSDRSADVGPYLEFFGIKEASFYFMTIEMRNLPEDGRDLVYLALRETVSAGAQCIIGPFMRNRVVVFMPCLEEAPATAGNGPRRRSDLRERIAQIHSRLATRLSLRIKIGVSSVESDYSRSLAAYNDSLKALMSTDDENAVVYSSDCTDTQAGEYPADAELRLLERASAGDIQSVHGLFGILSAWFAANYPDDPAVARSKYFELVALVRNLARRVEPGFGGFPVWKDTWRHFERLAPGGALEPYVIAGIDECLGVITEHRQNRMSPVILRACTIINESLSEDFSLEDISRRVEVSPFYFSKRFKEETGENFIDYLTMARMKRAKELLRDPARSIKEISAETGYSDPNYFSKLFKRVVGLTPTEFRESV